VVRDETINISLPNKEQRTYPKGTTPAQIAEDLGPEVSKSAVAAKVNGSLIDLARPLVEDGSLELVASDSVDGNRIRWHSTSHVLAQAVQDLFDNAKLAIGPAIDNGFYYDFDVPQPFSPNDLERIEARMQEIVDADAPFERREMPREDARRLFQAREEPYKVELIDGLEETEPVTVYQDGDFVDLCRGPHLPSAKHVGIFKLLSSAGAYWRGDERNPMLQRIYGVSFAKRQALDQFLAALEEAKRRDHRVLGRELDLFSVHDAAGAGLIHWHPKGARIRAIIEDFWRSEHYKRGYELVFTPHIASDRIYETSGHLKNYADVMYSPMDIDGFPYRLKPMNCPGHILIYQTQMRSYRDLPIRYAELGTVYRYERSGVLHGMLRVRGFTQDDSHIFCTPGQLTDEINGVLDLTEFMMRTFGYTYNVYLATRPEKSLGTDEEWKAGTEALRQALIDRQMEYEIDPGGGVFYAPKIDLVLRDCLGRQWQGPTIQVDLNLPNRFDIDYIGEDGQPHRVAMIHRTVLGSMERFIGGLIEHYGGFFPLWLAPVQALVIPISSDQHEYAQRVADTLKSKGIRIEIDARNEKMGYRIREAETQKIPYMIIVGRKEAEAELVSLRHHGEGDLGSVSLDALLSRMAREIETRAHSSLPEVTSPTEKP